MNKPHKHAALIKAWADGAEIERKAFKSQCSYPVWIPCPKPMWEDVWDYRIKPKTIKYRLFLWEHPVTKEISVESTSVDVMIPYGGFIKWLVDWQEVEV